VTGRNTLPYSTTVLGSLRGATTTDDIDIRAQIQKISECAAETFQRKMIRRAPCQSRRWINSLIVKRRSEPFQTFRLSPTNDRDRWYLSTP
jgi:hypothetical protein